MINNTDSCLNVQWTFGFGKDIINGVHNLSTPVRHALFCISAHSGIIYDYDKRSQTILQGHCNDITCAAVSNDKRWIVTADSGDDCIMVIWDSLSGAPVKTIFSPHTRGVASMDISEDALYVATLSKEVPGENQEIAVWAWTRDSDTALLREKLGNSDRHHSLRFNPAKQSEIAVTNGRSVSFWNWEEFKLEGYVGKVAKADFGHYSGKHTATVFLPSTGQAVTGTDDGFVIVWGSQFSTILLDDPSEHHMMMASKVFRLIDCAILTMVTVNDYIAVGCSDGAVRFYDYSLRLEAWFEDLSAGPITSLSFSEQTCPYAPGEGGVPGAKFWVPEFMVGTSDAFIVGVDSAVFDEVSPEERRGVLLVQGLADEVSGVSCHPFRTLLAISCYNGTIQMWDYDMKLLMNLREFNDPNAMAASLNATKASRSKKHSRLPMENKILRPQCLVFDPSGLYLAVGFTSGNIRILYAETLEDVATYTPSTEPIVKMKFSPSGQYFAAFDSSHHVIIFKRWSQEDDADDPRTDEEGNNKETYIYLGRILAHAAPITGLEFGSREAGEVLISVSEDRRAVEYDLEGSSVRGGIAIIDKSVRIELTARPTALMWLPHIGDDIEDRFVCANDEFKFKEYNADSKQCRKTTMAPSFGGPPNRLVYLPGSNERRCFAYSTAERIVGVGVLPLTGDPRNAMGLVAHPGRISDICLSHDGAYLFTCGGIDLTASMWSINPETFAGPQETPDEALMPFLELLEGGPGGELHNDIIDYFYLCQLRTQGESTMDVRAVTGRIPLEEISSLVRAVGYYPAEEEIENMCNEIRFKTFMHTGQTVNDLDLSEFIRLYVNHRPSIPLSNVDIVAAFDTLRKKYPNINNASWSELVQILTSQGEAFSSNDLDSCIEALLGDQASSILQDIGNFSESFGSAILGFEDVAQEE